MLYGIARSHAGIDSWSDLVISPRRNRFDDKHSIPSVDS